MMIKRVLPVIFGFHSLARKLLLTSALMLLSINLAQADQQTFVYAYANGQLLTATNPAIQCPDPENSFLVTEDCRGVKADSEGEYSLKLKDNDIKQGELVIVAHEFEFISVDSNAEINEDTYLLLDTHRRADTVEIGESNNGWDIDALSEAILDAIESVSHLPQADLGTLSERLVELLGNYDLSGLNDHMSTQEALAQVNLDKLDDHQLQLLVELAELMIVNQGSEPILAYIAKTVTQALLDPEAMPELVQQTTDVVSSIAEGNQAVLILEAPRYLLQQGETLQLSTTNSLNADQFFAYTWFGAIGSGQHASFSKNAPGSYMVCATGEVNNGNNSVTDCIRIIVLDPVEAIAEAERYKAAAGETVRINADNSINADQFTWSGQGSFKDDSLATTVWTAPLAAGSYEITLTVNGGDTDTITIEVHEQFPTAIAQTDSPILRLKDAPVSTLLKSMSVVSDGSAVDSQQWLVVSQPSAANATLETPNALTTQFTTDVPGFYTLQLDANKGQNSDSTTLQILVEQQGVPMAVAGGDRTTFRENIIILDGRGSYHPDNLAIKYQWSATGGAITNADQARSKYTSLIMGEYVATLTVSDDVASAIDQLNISVVNRQPQISDDSHAEFLDGLLEGQIIARDGDLDTLSYELIHDPSNGGLTFDVDSGKYWYVPGGEFGCKYRPDHKPVDNENGGKDVPVIKLCADKYSVSPGEIVTLTTSNSINTSKFSGFEWPNAQANPDDIREATFSSLTLGVHEVCVIGNVGKSRNTSTACAQIEVSNHPSGGGDVEDGYIDSFQARVSDGFENSRIATVKVNLNWKNIPPITQDSGPHTTNEDELIQGQLLAVDEDKHVLRYELITTGSLGLAEISDPVLGTFIYTPNKNISGSDQFTFKVNDDHDDSNISTVTININSVNDAPVISFDGELQTLEEQFIDGTVMGTDAEGDTLTYRVESLPVLADVTWPDTNAGSFRYSPQENLFGRDSFVVYANDGQADSNRLVIEARVGAVNDIPIVGDLTLTTWKDATATTAQIVAQDVETKAFTYFIEKQPIKGILTVDATSGELSYTPNGVDLGADSATFFVDDGEDRSAAGTLNIEILESNKPPVANNQSITVMAGVPYLGDLTGSDPDGDSFAYAIENPSRFGSARIIDRSSGSFRYATNAPADGVDSFTFMVNDGQKLSELATVDINIIGSDSVCRGPGHIAKDQDSDGFADYIELEFGTALDDAMSTPMAQLASTPYSFSFSDDDDLDGYLDVIELWFSTNYRDGTDAIIASPVSIPFCMTPSGDRQPPVMQGFNITTPVLDLTAGELPAGFVVTAIDNAVGIQRVNVDLVSPSGKVHKVAGKELDKPEMVLFTHLETSLFGQYSEQGEWVVASLEIVDAKGNVTLLDTAAMTELGYPTTVQVTNPQQDLTAPQYDSFDVLTPVVDLAAASPKASFAYSASDDLSGVALVEVTLRSPSGKQFKHVSKQFSAPALTVSAQLDTDTFSLYAEQGVWQVDELVVVDDAGNRAQYDNSEMAALGWPTDVELINATVDVEAPLEEAFDILTPRINPLNGNARAIYAVTASDALSGVKGLNVVLVSPSGGQQVSAGYSSIEAVTTLTVEMPSEVFSVDAEVGIWSVSQLVVVDGSGNERKMSTADLMAKGYATTLEVVNPVVVTPEVGTEPVEPTKPGGATPTDTGNTAPIAYCDSYTTNEDQVVESTLRGFDQDGDALTYYILDHPTQGSMVLIDKTTGAFSYTPAQNFHGSDSFTFMVDDGQESSNSCSIQFTMNTVIDQPYANDLALTMIVNGQIDAYLDGGTTEQSPVEYEIISPPSSGTIEWTHQLLGLFHYVPDTAFVGQDSFTYVAHADGLTSAEATVTIDVLPYGSGILFEVVEARVNRTWDEPRIAADIIPPIPPQDIYLLRVTLTSPSGVEQSLTQTGFLPETNYPLRLFQSVNTATELGEWVFSNLYIETVSGRQKIVLADDLAAAGFSDTVEVVDNTPPVAVDDSYQIVLGETLNFDLSASDADGDSLNYQLLSSTSLGVLTQLDTANPSVSYLANSLGKDSFTFIASDGIDDSNIATVSIEIVAPKEGTTTLPTAQDDQIEVGKNIAYQGGLKGSKGDATTITFAVIDQPSKGSINLTNSQTGEYIYRPNPDVLGADSFTFQVSGDGLSSRIATVSVAIVDTNGAPQANDLLVHVFNETEHSRSVMASDPDENPLTYEVVTPPEKGVFSMDSATGQFSYLTSETTGEDTFTYKVNDGLYDSNIATVTIEINACVVLCGDGGIYLSDIDGDGFSNTIEAIYGTDPENIDDAPQILGTESFDGDRDNDGYADYLEEWVGTNLSDPNSAPLELDPYYLPSCFQPESDGIKPRLQGFKILTTTLDVNNQNNVLEIAMVLSDNASGVRRVRVGLLSPSGDYYTTSTSFEQFPRLEATLFRASGFSQYAEEGQWHVAALTLFDEAGNVLSLTEDDLVGAGLVTTFDVVNGNSDAVAPSLVSLTIVDAEISPDSGSERFKFELSLQDLGSGVSAARIDLTSPSGTEISIAELLSQPTANAVITMQSDIVSRYLEMGDWTISGVMAYDDAGNSTQLVGELANNTVTVINPLSDSTPPVLDLFSVMTDTVYPSQGGQRISYSIGGYDTGAGIDAIYINLRGPSGQLLPTWAGLVDPAPSVLAQIDSDTLSTLMEAGEWKVENIEIIDEAGNSAYIEGAELESSGYTTTVTVIFQ